MSVGMFHYVFSQGGKSGLSNGVMVKSLPLQLVVSCCLCIRFPRGDWERIY